MISTWEMQQTLTAIVLFLLVTHCMGALFAKLRQPLVTGEIIGGLLLGPTVLGHFFPELFEALFKAPRTEVALSFVYNFGFMLLMYCSGLEVNPTIEKGQRKLVFALGLGATLASIAIAFLLFGNADLNLFMGSAQSTSALKLILGISVAVTSIPVISRILIDLGLIRSDFAKNILAAAILDDLLLYIALGVALTWIAGKQPPSAHPGLLVVWTREMSPVPALVTIALAQAALIYGGVRVGRKLIRLIESGPLRFLADKSPTAFHLVVLVTVTVCGMALGITPFLSAFCAGLIASALKKTREPSSAELHRFSFGFFIPLYFGIVGFRVNLLKDFSLEWFGLLFAALILIKMVTVAVFAAGLKLPRRQIFHYAVTLAAKGGPGIVIATTALDAGIINATLASILILTSILSSALVGGILAREKKLGKISLERSLL